MRAFSFVVNSIAKRSFMFAMITLISVGTIFAQTQSSSADLAGTVVDQSGAVIPGVTVTIRDPHTNITKSTTTNESGEYKFIGLPPGDYDITAEAKTFKKSSIKGVVLTIGQAAQLEIKLEVGSQDVVVDVPIGSVQLIETTTSNVANTIDQQKIESLPINERSATGFALTLSTVGRDNGRPIGPAPTSGLNIGGQRGRSTQVNVDGSDFTDNSTNASRSTVSQEAVQEYQISTNSYTAEFGRATGGVINVVTKRGTNEWHGNVFGYLRDKSIQARNAFAPVAKPDYRRTQYGFTLGGPVKKDRTFFFLAFERRQRDESGFFTSDVSQGLTGSVVLTVPGLPSQTFDRITPAQATYANTLLTTGNTLIAQGTTAGAGTPAGAALIAQGTAIVNAGVQYLYLASSGGKTALTGTNTLLNPGSVAGLAAGAVVGSRFFLSGAPVPVSANAFRPLNDLLKVFPITDRSNYSSIRGDHNIDANNQLSLRFGYNTSDLTGIQVESQNQSLGQNDFSRTGITVLKDASFSMGLNSTLGGSMANEFKFTFGKRKTSFKSQNGEAVAYNISGTAFIGRELFSPVDRQENRFQLADNLTWVKGNHTFKFGADFNWIEIPEARFELNFAGLFNFGEFAATNLAAFPTVGGLSAPAFTPVQSYGLGLPSIFIQGFGNPISKINNKPMAFFAQDSWKMFRNFTVNYGIRYDFELTKLIPTTAFSDPLSGISLSADAIKAAQDAMGVQQGFPRDKNNWAPRLGFAWDVFGDQKTKLSGSIGYYYDHPLLAVGFNSDVADAAQQQQSVLTPGSPAPTSLFNATQVFQGTVCGVVGSASALCGAAVTPGVASSAQYQFGRQRFNDQTFTGFGAVLPFTLPVAKDFQYASATQGNLTIERQLTSNMALSASYIYVGAHHLPRPTDLNTPNTALQIQNFNRLTGRNPASTTEAISFSIPSTAAAGLSPCPGAPTLLCFTLATPAGAPAYPNAGTVFAALVPGMVAAPLANLNNRVVAPAIANFFRPSAPNYFLAQALSGGAVTKTVLDGALTGSLRTPGIISPFGSVNAQLSDGNSSYNAMKLDLNRRFANNITFLASYTWSHSIDDSSDLQTLLIAQNVNRFDLEKADSLFDQRHRFVFSGAMTSPIGWRNGNGWQKFLSDFTVAPIIEISSGRPFNIITNVDTNNDQSTQTDRPNVEANGVLTLPAPFTTGVLGRNMGITHGYFSVDLGITRAIRFGEKVRLDIIAQGFNLLNRFNEASASPLFTDVNAFGQRAGNGRYFSRPTAAYDPRQFQFGLKLNF